MDSTSQSLKSHFAEFSQLLISNQGLTAIDRYYHPDIHQYENNQEPLIGRTLLRAKEETVLQSITSLAVSLEDVVVVENQQLVWGRMTITFDSEELGKKILDQAFMQRWQDGLIKEQRFYYEGVRDQE